ncbi:MAG: hypothetical protein GX136_06510 [Clostridiales bacterium]|jgi:hypothetical protein|nr:hypothetical protein [Clostridiales bacterium]
MKCPLCGSVTDKRVCPDCGFLSIDPEQNGFAPKDTEKPPYARRFRTVLTLLIILVAITAGLAFAVHYFDIEMLKI